VLLHDKSLPLSWPEVSLVWPEIAVRLKGLYIDAMIPPVRGWTSPDWTGPSLVQSSP